VILLTACSCTLQRYAEAQARGQVPAALLETGVNPAVFEIAGHMVLKRAQDYEVGRPEVWGASRLSVLSCWLQMMAPGLFFWAVLDAPVLCPCLPASALKDETVGMNACTCTGGGPGLGLAAA